MMRRYEFSIIVFFCFSKCKVQDMKHIINFVCTYIRCLPMSLEVRAPVSSEVEEEVRHTYDDEILDASSSTYADITSFICEVFLKIAVQYCHANMEYNVVNACLKGEFYNGTMTCRFPSSIQSSEEDLIFNDDDKVSSELVSKIPLTWW